MSELPDVPESVAKLVKPLLLRAKEVEQVDPSISYFCKLYAAESILTRGLHNSSQEVAVFAMALLDDVERSKKEASPEVLEIIESKEARYAHVEQFGVAIFNKAYLDVYNHKTSKATVETFRASVVFLELLKLWDQELDDDIKMKVRFAKFHAMRILKAYKAGDDPNDYSLPESELKSDRAGSPETEAAPQEDLRLHDATKLPSPPVDDTPQLPSAPVEETDSPKLPTAPRFIDGDESSMGLPRAPRFIEDDANMGLPKAPRFIDDEAPELPEPETDTHPADLSDVLPSAPETKPKPEEAEENPVAPPKASIPLTPKTFTPIVPPKTSSPRATSQTTPKPPSETSRKSSVSKQDIQKMILDDEVISKAQKHAKYAISALNYEDIATAIKELEDALGLLKG